MARNNKVEIVIKDAWDIPEYQTSGSAGLDLHANNDTPMLIKPGHRAVVHTGIHISMPEGMEAQIRPRSGLVLKHGITVLNSPGTIDSDYRGEVMVILHNAGNQPFFVNKGDRVAQMVFANYARPQLVEVESLTDTDRGSGGFGHTGK